jgi:hypothetical protein
MERVKPRRVRASSTTGVRRVRHRRSGSLPLAFNRHWVCSNFRDKVKVRIKATPREAEVDGIRLDTFAKGDVREVSAIIGAWLIAEGYAEPEMRLGTSEQHGLTSVTDRRDPARARRHRRSSDY